jgi:tetratricopeptide (TPR) repeat protein
MPAQPQPSLPGAAGKKLADGDRAMAEKRYRDASFAYTDAVHADPNSVEGRFKLGNSLAVLGYYQQAVDQWTFVTKLSKDPAVLAQAQGNITKAQAKIAQVGSSPPAAGRPPGSGPVAETSRTQARSLYEQGIAQIRARDYGNALASLSSAVQLEPALTVGYLARGSALVGLRRFSEAALDYGYALKLEPASAAPLYGLAVSYQGLSRTDDARQYFQKYIASTAPDVRPELQTDARNNLEKLKP